MEKKDFQSVKLGTRHLNHNFRVANFLGDIDFIFWMGKLLLFSVYEINKKSLFGFTKRKENQY